MTKVQIIGRIDESEQYNGLYYTTVTTPAADSYSRPSSYRVRSTSPLGNAGAELIIDCALSGFVQKKNVPNRRTGELMTIHDANIFFEVVNFQVKQSPAPVRNAS